MKTGIILLILLLACVIPFSVFGLTKQRGQAPFQGLKKSE